MRIGFCCKWLNDRSEFGGMKVNAKDRELNGRSTTMRWLREHREDAEQRQWDIMNHNAAAANATMAMTAATATKTATATAAATTETTTPATMAAATATTTTTAAAKTMA